MTVRPPAIRAALEEGRPAFGTFVYSPDPAVCELVGAAGFDFVVVDTEHASLGPRDVENLVRAADTRGIAALVRVTRPDAVTTSLDAGAAGIVLPHFGADERSRVLVASARYHPAGDRGACTGSRAVAYGLDDFAAYAARSNEDVLVVGQIEDAASVEALDEVLSMPGLDAVLPGRSDLAASYGVAGRLDDPAVTGALDRIAEAAARHGVTLGMYVTGAAAGREWRHRGARLIVCSIDYKVLSAAYAALLSELHAAS